MAEPVYAVIETGGKQYKVEKGSALLVDRLPAKEGEKVSLRPVLFRDGEVITDRATLEKVKVEATVAEHLRGPKVKVFKYKPKKGYRRRAGHRSELSRLEVTEIRKLARKPAAKASTASRPAEKKKPARKRTTTARKPAGRRTTTKKASDGS